MSFGLIFLVFLASLVLTFAFKILLPARRARSVVIVIGLIPAVLFVAYRTFRQFVEIGRYDELNGSPPPNMIDNLLLGIVHSAALGAVWLLAIAGLATVIVWSLAIARRK
ncbi:hypothetical protein ACRAQ7_11735 [Erythrobacter sp. W53]|uniref:hypothetical protein n=1 Tax=Erythrobacter sp. W53 TaxID=3425947 RepID=UPI003D769C2C